MIVLRIFFGCLAGLLAIRSVLTFPYDLNMMHVIIFIICIGVIYVSAEKSVRIKAFIGLCAFIGVFGTTSLVFRYLREVVDGVEITYALPEIAQLFISVCGLIIFGIWSLVQR